jgi:cysteine desulfurase
MQRPVYLDNAATTRMDPLVFEAMRPWFMEGYGNASSGSHLFGWEAKDAVEEAREQVAALIGARSKEVCFTSGATESVNLALKGMAEGMGLKGLHIVTCATEHRAVLDTCLHLERLGCSVSVVGVDERGCLDLAEVAGAIRRETRLMAIMHANNETGVIHPVREISRLARERNVLVFCDATQTAGKLPIEVDDLGVDLMAFSAHKFHGPKGVGALYVRKRDETVGLVAQLDGGRQERGLRSGTLNVPGIVGMGVAGGLASQRMHADMDGIGSNRERLEKSLLRIRGVRLNGQPAGRLHTISNLTFEGRDGFAILRANAVAFAASPGSACSSTVQHPSHVLKAMGLTDHQAGASVRFSLGRFNTREEVDLVILALEGYLGALP